MEDLIARLNTYQSLNNTTAEEKAYGAGIYLNFGEESETYRNGTFQKVINAILEQAFASGEKSYKKIAQDVKNALSQQGPLTKLEIMVYDPKNDTFIRNANNEESLVMDLNEKVEDYIVQTTIDDNKESKEIDYLDIVVRLNSAVGGK